MSDSYLTVLRGANSQPSSIHGDALTQKSDLQSHAHLHTQFVVSTANPIVFTDLIASMIESIFQAVQNEFVGFLNSASPSQQSELMKVIVLDLEHPVNEQLLMISTNSWRRKVSWNSLHLSISIKASIWQDLCADSID
jgi:hypothetical protein